MTCTTVRTVLVVAASLPLVAGLAAQPATAVTNSPVAAAQLSRGYQAPSKAVSLRQANALKTANPASLTGYSRTKFPHWRDASTWGWPVAPSNRCNARNAALYRDGRNVRINSYCTVTSGSWLDPYTASTYTNKASIDVDHIVPLAAAWRGGAGRWSTTRRTQFANDPVVLVSVQDKVNQSKGDKTPDLWKPPNRAAWCLYGKRYTSVKAKYALTVTANEKKALVAMIGTCRA